MDGKNCFSFFLKRLLFMKFFVLICSHTSFAVQSLDYELQTTNGGKIPPIRESNVSVDKILDYMLFSHDDNYWMFPPFKRVYNYEKKLYSTKFSMKASVGAVLMASVERSYEFKFEKNKSTIFYVAPSYIVEEKGKKVKCEALNPIGKPDLILELKDILNKEIFHKYIDTKYAADPLKKVACKKIPIMFNCVMAQSVEFDRNLVMEFGMDVNISFVNLEGQSIPSYSTDEGVEVDSISGFYPVPYSYTYYENGTQHFASVRIERDMEKFCEKFIFPQKEKTIRQQVNSTVINYFVKDNFLTCSEDHECPAFKDERTWYDRQFIGAIGTAYSKCLPMKITSSAFVSQQDVNVCQFRSSRGSKCYKTADEGYPACLDGLTCVGYKEEVFDTVDPQSGASFTRVEKTPGVCY